MWRAREKGEDWSGCRLLLFLVKRFLYCFDDLVVLIGPDRAVAPAEVLEEHGDRIKARCDPLTGFATIEFATFGGSAGLFSADIGRSIPGHAREMGIAEISYS